MYVSPNTYKLYYLFVKNHNSIFVSRPNTSLIITQFITTILQVNDLF